MAAQGQEERITEAAQGSKGQPPPEPQMKATTVAALMKLLNAVGEFLSQRNRSWQQLKTAYREAREAVDAEEEV
ncbi:MAG: hypothetical protein KKF27_20030 [Gammaproteobacteria bacterium]|uniref:Uncharacterized protein n=1 Tax=viral metagenome TaxID=1070528 RepID=A0A6M3JNZ5_9ZZZZ|nr:hypothetical protein [Gammaproteobacteria bacterium]